MKNKLYVGNISYQMVESDLEDIFASHGEVKSVKIIKEQDTGRSKGFGFIEMSSEDEANAAQEAMDGQEVSGRNLKVSIALDKKGPSRRGGGNFSGNR